MAIELLWPQLRDNIGVFLQQTFVTQNRVLVDEAAQRESIMRLENIRQVEFSATTELWLLYHDSVSEKFPQWPLVFSVMRVMGAVNRLSRETKQVLEL